MKKSILSLMLLAPASLCFPSALWAVDLIIDQSLGNSPFDITASATYEDVIVGQGGNGTLNVVQQNLGGALFADTLIVGNNAGSVGDVSLIRFIDTLVVAQIASQTIGNAGIGVVTHFNGANLATVGVFLGAQAGSTGIYELRNAGDDGRALLQTAVLRGGAGNSIFNFNGGILRPNESDSPGAPFVSGLSRVNVRDNGAIIDTNGYNVTFASPISHSNFDPGDVATDGGLTKNGNGTLTLSGAASHTGGTTINGGTLTVSGNGSLGSSSGPITANGGTLDLAGKGFGAGLVTLTGGTIRNGALLASAYDGRSGVASADLAGSGAVFTKTTSDTLLLSGANSYTGGTNINAGTLQFGKINSMPGSGTISVAGGAVLAVNVGGVGEFGSSAIGALLSGTGSQGAPVTFAPGSFVGIDLTNATGGALSYSGVISDFGGNQRGLIKLGSGTLTLAGANTYTGGTQINGGTLALSGAGTLGGSSGPLTLNGGSLNLGGKSVAMGLVTNNGGDILNGTLNATSYNLAGNSTISAILAGNGVLTRNVDFTLTTLTAANSYTGGTVINGGTLALSGAGTLGNSSSPLTVSGGGLDLGGKTQTVSVLNVTGGTIGNGSLITSAYNLDEGDVSANLGGNGAALNKNGSDRLVLSGNNTYSGGTFFHSGSIYAASPGALGTGPVTFLEGDDPRYVMQLNGSCDPSGRIVNSTSPIRIFAANETGFTNATFASSLSSSNTGGLIVRGGTLVLSAPNAFSGPIVITTQAGFAGGAFYDFSGLAITGAGTLGNPNNPLYLYNQNCVLDLGGTSQTVGAVTMFQPFDPSLFGSSRLEEPGNFIQNGTLNATSLAALKSTVTANLSVTAGIRVEQNFLYFRGLFEPGLLTFSGNQVSTGPVGAKSGFNAGFNATMAFTNGAQLDLDSLANGGVNTGAYIVDGTLSVSGASTALSVGNLSLSATSSSGNFFQTGGSVTATQILFGSGSVCNLNGGTLTSGNLSGSGNGTIRFNGGTLRAGATSTTFINNLAAAQVRNGGGIIDTNGFNVTIAQPLVHSPLAGDAAIDGGLTKIGTGTLSLSAANSYTGGTDINAGTLQFARTNSLPASGTVAVASGAVLAVNAGGSGEFTNTTSGVGSIGGLLAGSNGQGGAVTFASGAFLGIDTTTASFGLFPYGGVIADTNGGANPLGLVKLGSGTLLLSGTSQANTYTGDTLVNAGTLALSKPFAGPTNNFGSAMGGNLIVNNGGTVRYNADSQVRDDKNITVKAGGTLNLNGFAESIVNLAVFGGSVTTGTGYVNVRGTLSADGSTTSSYAGNLHLETPIANGPGTVSVAGGGRFNVSAVVGNGDNGLATKLTKTGSGTLILSGANTYSGGTTVNAGTLIVSGSIATTSTVNVNAGLLAFTSSQTLDQLHIADGAVAVLDANFAPAPAPSLDEVAITDPGLGEEAACFDEVGSASSFGGALQADAVPEPGSVGLLCAGVLGLLARRRRSI